MHYLNSLLTEPSGQSQHAEWVHSFRREDWNHFDRKTRFLGLLAKDSEMSQADKARLDTPGKVLARGEEKILGASNRHRDEEKGNLHRLIRLLYARGLIHEFPAMST
jgi:hypothetical protein